MNRKSIIEHYEKMIDNVKDENEKENLLQDLEMIEETLSLFESMIENELENQDDHLPSTKEYLDDFEACRKELML